jgi:hypothetical protein
VVPAFELVSFFAEFTTDNSPNHHNNKPSRPDAFPLARQPQQQQQQQQKVCLPFLILT